MKELLIFLLLIFFIEAKKQNSRLSLAPKKKPRIFRCIGGRIVSGFCNCPIGTKYYGGKCSRFAPVPCLHGRISNNKCVCPKRTRLKNGSCVKV